MQTGFVLSTYMFLRPSFPGTYTSLSPRVSPTLSQGVGSEGEGGGIQSKPEFFNQEAE